MPCKKLTDELQCLQNRSVVGHIVSNALDKRLSTANRRHGFHIQQADEEITPCSKSFGAIGVADELRIYGELHVAPTQCVTMINIPSHP